MSVMVMKRYKAIIFDMDGTVLDTLDELTSSLNHIFALHQLAPKSAQDVRACLGYGYVGLIERAAPHADETLKAQLTDEFKSYYGSHCQGHTHPYDGITDVLLQLRKAGYATAIVSNKGQQAVSSLHDEFFQDLVDFSLGESPAFEKKPAPDMVWEALRRLDCAAADAVYVGDSEVDKLTADHAGLTSVLVTWGFRDKPFLEGLHPDYIVDSRQELADLFLAHTPSCK